MLFNSYPFIFIYLPIVLVGFFWIARTNQVAGIFWLGLLSLVFYSYDNPKLVVLLLMSIAINFLMAIYISRLSRRYAKYLLIATIGANLLCLGFFKYLNFFISTANYFHADWPVFNILLPVGISFFTFTQIAFLVDVYRGLAKETVFTHYLLFVTWFPHLIAGPVLHHSQMMPQFKSAAIYRPSWESLAVGATFFTIGLFKKVVLADEFALFANPLFDGAATGTDPKLLAAWVGAIAYALQLYFDFSGYCDMAIGLSRLFNIKLPLNFDSPYRASSMIDFWRRWHITLSRFLRDYLYVPLGGNKKGQTRRYLNLMITMILGGLWHGANWTFVLWGALHGGYLLLNHFWRAILGQRGGSTARASSRALFRVLSVGLTFTAVVVAWVPFRSESLEATLNIWRGMFGLNGLSLPAALAPFLPDILRDSASFAGFMPELRASTTSILLWMTTGLVIVWCLPNTQQWLALYAPAWDAVAVYSRRLTWKPSAAYGFALGIIFAISVMLFKKNSPFLYYQF